MLSLWITDDQSLILSLDFTFLKLLLTNYCIAVQGSCTSKSKPTIPLHPIWMYVSARYQQDYDGMRSKALAQRYYHQALAICPQIGQSISFWTWVIARKKVSNVIPCEILVIALSVDLFHYEWNRDLCCDFFVTNFQCSFEK